MESPLRSPLLHVLLGPIVAVLQLFCAYVLMHGHYSPGGGFQAGVILAAAFILPLLVHGRDARPHGFLVLSQRRALRLAAVGVLLYVGIGIAAMLAGGSLLDYDALPLPGAPAQRRALGILGVEVGVTLAVAGAVVAIFRSLREQEIAPYPGEGGHDL